MMKYDFGDVVFIEFYEFASKNRKRRPAMVVLDVGDVDVVVCPITSRERNGLGDYKLKDWEKCGLKKNSWVRLAKLSCLEKSDIVRIFGKIIDEDKIQLRKILCTLIEEQ